MSDPFSILGLAAAFDVSSEAIEHAYLKRAALAHPDLVGNDEEAARIAAELNGAKSQLLDAEARANALLEILGGPAKEADKSLPDGFLMDILETREKIQEAVASGDSAQTAAWELWASQEQSRYIQEVSEQFAQKPVPLKSIRRTLNAWRYVERLLEQLAPGYRASDSQ